MTQPSAARMQKLDRQHEAQLEETSLYYANKLCDLVGHDRYNQIVDTLSIDAPWSEWAARLQSEYNRAVEQSLPIAANMRLDPATPVTDALKAAASRELADLRQLSDNLTQTIGKMV